MWQSAHHSSHHGGNECFDPDRDRFAGWGRGQGHEQHHGGGWNEHAGFNDPGWGGGQACHNDPGWGGLGDCHDDRGWGGPGDCHDGGRGLIGADHNSFLVCH
jgi:hypothetical protein